ncbi:hypothetical protein POM88_044989 [Heracleum sosnowskyi]|uniref:Uncharacterized protein n=1 Tax=Heracleum sosnowskyi TaxID=360622 RepID=A0AAD8H3U2_9APIA|nr:hypothetical protein POM88_044989 [Heracleum sosnowskyi]
MDQDELKMYLKPKDELRMYPEPKDPFVLHLQADHRSSMVWEVGGGDNQRSRHRDPNNIKFPHLHSRMVPILQALRFDGHVRGVKPGKEGLVGGRVKCTWLNKIFPSLPDNASDLKLQRYTQSYLLQLIGGVLFTDHSDGQVHGMYY